MPVRRWVVLPVLRRVGLPVLRRVGTVKPLPATATRCAPSVEEQAPPPSPTLAATERPLRGNSVGAWKSATVHQIPVAAAGACFRHAGWTTRWRREGFAAIRRAMGRSRPLGFFYRSRSTLTASPRRNSSSVPFSPRGRPACSLACGGIERGAPDALRASPGVLVHSGSSTFSRRFPMIAMMLWAAMALAPAAAGDVCVEPTCTVCDACDCCGCCETGTCTCKKCGCDCCVEE